MYSYLDFFVLNFPEFSNKLCIYGANGLWSGATPISDGIFTQLAVVMVVTNIRYDHSDLIGAQR